MNPADHKALVRTMLVNEAERKLYNESAGFKIAVDQLAAWLPIWISGMAENSRQREEELAQQVISLERRLPLPLTLIPADPPTDES